MQSAFTELQLEQMQSVVSAAIAESTKILDARIDKLGNELADNTKRTSDIRELFDTAKNGLKLAGLLGAFMKWLAGVATSIVVVYSLWGPKK